MTSGLPRNMSNWSTLLAWYLYNKSLTHPIFMLRTIKHLILDDFICIWFVSPVQVIVSISIWQEVDVAYYKTDINRLSMISPFCTYLYDDVDRNVLGETTCCVFVLFSFILCTLCWQFLRIVQQPQSLLLNLNMVNKNSKPWFTTTCNKIRKEFNRPREVYTYFFSQKWGK